MWGSVLLPIIPVSIGQTPTTNFDELIDWSVVSSIDLDLILKSGDITRIQPFLTNFVGLDLSNSDSSILSHPLSRKLCRILQVSLILMSNVQKRLLNKLTTSESELSLAKQKIHSLKKYNQKSQNLLKNQLKQIEKCPICSRSFSSIKYLDKHIERKHSEIFLKWKSIRNKGINPHQITKEPRKKQHNQNKPHKNQSFRKIQKPDLIEESQMEVISDSSMNSSDMLYTSKLKFDSLSEISNQEQMSIRSTTSSFSLKKVTQMSSDEFLLTNENELSSSDFFYSSDST